MLLRCWRCWFFLYTSNFKKEMSFEISLTSTHPTLAEHSIWEELHIQSSGSEDGTNSEEQSSQQGSQQQGSQQQGSEESDEPMQQAVFFYSTSDAIGTQYVMQFSATEQPAVVGIQGDIVSNGWTWDGGSNLLTITLELVDFGQNTDFGVEGIEGKNVIAIGFIAAAKNNGPPPEATGMWMATNVLDWRMKPPGKDGRFGVVLYGPDGHTGFFKMYIPNALITWLNSSKDRLVMFENGEQSSINSTSDANGVLFTITTKFDRKKSDVLLPNARGIVATHLRNLGHARSGGSGLIKKTFTTGKSMPVSLSSNLTVVGRRKKIKLFGWIGNFRKGRIVRIYQKKRVRRRLPRARRWRTYYMFRYIGRRRTKSNGYWSMNKRIYRNSQFRVKYGRNRSNVKKIQID